MSRTCHNEMLPGSSHWPQSTLHGFFIIPGLVSYSVDLAEESEDVNTVLRLSVVLLFFKEDFILVLKHLARLFSHACLRSCSMHHFVQLENYLPRNGYPDFFLFSFFLGKAELHVSTKHATVETGGIQAYQGQLCYRLLPAENCLTQSSFPVAASWVSCDQGVGDKETKGRSSPVGYAYSFLSTCKPFPNGLMCLGNGLCPSPLSRFAPCYVKVYAVRKRHWAIADGGDTSSLQCPNHLPSGWGSKDNSSAL